MISFEDVKPVGDPDNPDIFEVNTHNVNMIAILGKKTPNTMLPKLQDLFPDLTEDDLLNFRNGLSVTATILPNRPAKVNIVLLRKVTKRTEPLPSAAVTGKRFEDVFGLLFPSETFLTNNTETQDM